MPLNSLLSIELDLLTLPNASEVSSGEALDPSENRIDIKEDAFNLPTNPGPIPLLVVLAYNCVALYNSVSLYGSINSSSISFT